VLRASHLPIAIASPLLGAFAVLALLACQPKVQLEAPKEPITINLNVKIEHEVRVKVDRELDQLFEQESDLF
jgi:hypothetical protein